MAIVFEPAQPLSTSTSYAYGALQQAAQDRDYSLKREGMDQQERLAMAHLREQNLQAQQSAMNEQGRISAQENMAANAQAMHRQQFESQQQPSERDQWMAGQQQSLARQHYAAQQELAQQQFTQADNLQLQRVNQAISQINANPDYSPEDKTEAIAHVRGIQGPLQIRQQRAQVQQKEAQTKQMQEQMAQTEAARGLDEQFALGNTDKLPMMTDPVSGKQYRMLRDKQGKWYDPFEPIRAHELKLKEMQDSAAEKKRTHESDVQASADKHADADWERQRNDALKHVDAINKLKMANLTPEAAAAKEIELESKKPEDIAYQLAYVHGRGKTLAEDREWRKGRPANGQQPPAPTATLDQHVDALFSGKAVPQGRWQQSVAAIGKAAEEEPPEKKDDLKDMAKHIATGEYQNWADKDWSDFKKRAVENADYLPSNVKEQLAAESQRRADHAIKVAEAVKARKELNEIGLMGKIMSPQIYRARLNRVRGLEEQAGIGGR